MRLIRVFFEKTGRAKYISHLDLNRTMARCIRRAEIPVWYTEGFNPHPFISFGLPLALGVESLYETMDIKPESDMTDGEMLRRLAAVSPEGLTVKKVAPAVHKPAEIVAAEYEMSFMGCGEDEAHAMHEILKSGDMMAKKMVKKGKAKVEKEINLAGGLRKYDILTRDGYVLLKVTLDAGISRNLNPVLFCDTVCEKLGITPYKVKILKICSLMSNREKFC